MYDQHTFMNTKHFQKKLRFVYCPSRCTHVDFGVTTSLSQITPPWPLEPLRSL